MKKAKPELRFTFFIYIPLAIIAPVWLFLSAPSIHKTIFYSEILFNLIAYILLIILLFRTAMTKKINRVTPENFFKALFFIIALQIFLLLFHQQFLTNLQIKTTTNDFIFSLPFTIILAMQLTKPFVNRTIELCRIYYFQQTQLIWISSNLTVMGLGLLQILFPTLQLGIASENFLIAALAMTIAKSAYILRWTRYLAHRNAIALLLGSIILCLIILTILIQFIFHALPFYEWSKTLFSALNYNSKREIWQILVNQLWWLSSISFSAALLKNLTRYLPLGWLALIYLISGFCLGFLPVKFNLPLFFSVILFAGLLIILQRSQAIQQLIYVTLHPQKKLRFPVIAFRAFNQNLFLIFALFLLLPTLSYLFLAWLGIMPLIIIYFLLLINFSCLICSSKVSRLRIKNNC